MRFHRFASIILLFGVVFGVAAPLSRAQEPQPVIPAIAKGEQRIERCAAPGAQMVIKLMDAGTAALECVSPPATPTAEPTASPTSAPTATVFPSPTVLPRPTITATTLPPATALPATPLPTATGLPTATAPPELDTILTPQRLPLDGDEIPGPGRGLYRWNGQTYICPSALASNQDAYRRWNWAKIETSQGVYNWSLVRAELDTAQARGQRLWIGIGVSAGPQKYGPYLPGYMLQPGWGEYFAGDWYPNFNNLAVRARLEAMLDAFKAEFGQDQRIAGLQMLSYGRFGELYLPWDAPKTHVMWATPATAEWMVNAWHSRFADRFQLSIPLSNVYIFKYALGKTPHWGWTRMALGWPDQMRNVDTLMASTEVVNGIAIGPAVRDRWMTAPIMTEMIGDLGTQDYSNQFRDALAQVLRYHVSLVSNGNFLGTYSRPPWNFWQSCQRDSTSSWTDQNISDFVLAGKRAGYRYSIEHLRISPAQPGQSLKIATTWVNDGVAPIYLPYKVRVDLRRVDTGVLAWSGVSQVDLRKVLPGTTTIQDTFALPTAVAPGRYAVHVYTPPLNPYLTPLRFAMGGRNTGGGYELGAIEVKTP